MPEKEIADISHLTSYVQKARLYLFQNECLHTLEPSTHKIDQWMTRFLLNYALPLERKQEDTPHNRADQISSHLLTERSRFTNDVFAVLQ